MKSVAIFLLLALGASPVWAGDIYKWDDAKGITRYSDQAPPPGAKNVQKYRSTGSGLAAEKPAAAPPQESGAAAEKPAEKTTEKLEVTLYSFDECGDVCKQAEELLNKRGVPYTRKGDNNAKIELQKLTGKLDVPVMVIGNTAPISGFQEERWNKELDLAGYAKSNPNVKPGTSMAIKPPPRAEPSATEPPAPNSQQP
jgi:glutaredoxin